MKNVFSFQLIKGALIRSLSMGLIFFLTTQSQASEIVTLQCADLFKVISLATKQAERNSLLEQSALQRAVVAEFKIYKTNAADGEASVFTDEFGNIITDEATLKRFADLKIRSDLHDVRISTDPTSHIQAVGLDESNKIQYLYHADWLQIRQSVKSSAMTKLSEKIGDLRKQNKVQLQAVKTTEKSFTKEDVLALAVQVLDETALRVGNSESVTRNKTYGLTTLLKKNVEFVDRDKVILNFVAKGQSRFNRSTQIEITNPETIELLKKLVQNSSDSERLFQYQVNFKNGQSVIRHIEATDVNQYLKKVTSEDITAKDFRTWKASTVALQSLSRQRFTDLDVQDRVVSNAVKNAAKKLANSEDESLNSYILPEIINLFKNNRQQFNEIMLQAQKISRRSPNQSTAEIALQLILQKTKE